MYYTSHPTIRGHKKRRTQRTVDFYVRTCWDQPLKSEELVWCWESLWQFLYIYWLVVTGTFVIFPYIGNVIIPTDEVHHFSEELKPPTSLCQCIHIDVNRLYLPISWYIDTHRYMCTWHPKRQEKTFRFTKGTFR